MQTGTNGGWNSQDTVRLAVRASTLPNVFFSVGCGGGSAGASFPSLSDSGSRSNLPASFRHRRTGCDFALPMNEDGGVDGPEGELADDIADADERDEREGDVDSVGAGTARSGVARLGTTAIPRPADSSSSDSSETETGMTTSLMESIV